MAFLKFTREEKMKRKNYGVVQKWIRLCLPAKWSDCWLEWIWQVSSAA